MKQKTKLKKQLGATHPICESERIEDLMRIVSNPGESGLELEYDKTPRTLCIPSDVEETSGIHIDRKDLAICQ